MSHTTTKETKPKREKNDKGHEYRASNHKLTKHVSIRRGLYRAGRDSLMGGEKTEMTGDASS